MKLLDKDGLTYYTGKIKNELTDYVKNTDYATAQKGGVIKKGYYLSINNSGTVFAEVLGYELYSRNDVGNNIFISKGTLENVITGKSLETANNKVISISSSSTDTQYPSAKAVYDYIQSLNGNEVSY